MKKLLLASVLLLFAAGAANATIVTITFDDMDLLGEGGTPNLYTEDGFSFAVVPDVGITSQHLDSGNDPVVVHTTDRTGGLEITFGGSPFSLLSFDYGVLAGVEASITANDGRTLLLPGSGELPLVTTVIDFGNMTSAVFGINDLSGGYLFFDNLVVRVVPEPASLALLGLGLSGMVVIRRRRM